MQFKISSLLLIGLLWGTASYAYNVTFRVNMSDVTDAYTTPEVNGTFNGFCGGCAQMTDVGGNVWEIVIDLDAGDYEYKFAADNWNIQEDLVPGSSCTVTNFGFTNRLISVVDQDIDIGTVCWGACQDCGVAPAVYDVTFRVNMAEVADAYTTPEVNGTFNGWCGGCAPMTNIGADVWEIVIPLEVGTYEYKFAADTWNIQENLTPGTACTVTSEGFTNRTLQVVDQNIDLGTVCWASCQDCGVSAAVYDVIFRVDMSDVTEAYTTPEVNGTFNGWCGGCAPMTNVGGDVWELVIALEAGTYEYKFAADGWNIQENLAAGDVCTITTEGFTNRALTVVDQNIDLGTPCWASCVACENDNGGGGEGCDLLDLTFDDSTSVTDWQEMADATGPEASISWEAAGNGSGAINFTGINASEGIGKAFIFEYLDPNFDYAGATSVELSFDVKFGSPYVGAALHLLTEIPGVGVINNFDIQNQGINENDWTNLTFTFNGVGAGNLFRMHFNVAAGAFVGAGGTVLVDNIVLTCDLTPSTGGCTDPNAVNFDETATENDGSCEYNVTFRVNMAEVIDPYTTPEVNGTFNDFCGGCAPMTNIVDDVWEITIPLAVGSYEFKYAADSWNIQEALTEGSSCTVTNFGFTNRLLEVVDQNIDLGTVCWGSCQDCGSVSPVYNVTFSVDMAEVAEPFTTPEVNGIFNGWCGGCAPMTNVAGSIWEITIPLEAGSYQYKFAADGWSIQENLTPGSSCTVTQDGFTNRLLNVTDSDITLETVCWASCEACVPSEVIGCTYAGADNYNPQATSDDGNCIFSGCTNSNASNYNPFANNDDGSCVISCAGDLNLDGVVNSVDLALFLAAYGTACN